MNYSDYINSDHKTKHVMSGIYGVYKIVNNQPVLVGVIEKKEGVKNV
jgi:hypothetical protein